MFESLVVLFQLVLEVSDFVERFLFRCNRGKRVEDAPPCMKRPMRFSGLRKRAGPAEERRVVVFILRDQRINETPRLREQPKRRCALRDRDEIVMRHSSAERSAAPHEFPVERAVGDRRLPPRASGKKGNRIPVRASLETSFRKHEERMSRQGLDTERDLRQCETHAASERGLDVCFSCEGEEGVAVDDAPIPGEREQPFKIRCGFPVHRVARERFCTIEQTKCFEIGIGLLLREQSERRVDPLRFVRSDAEGEGFLTASGGNRRSQEQEVHAEKRCPRHAAALSCEHDYRAHTDYGRAIRVPGMAGFPHRLIIPIRWCSAVWS